MRERRGRRKREGNGASEGGRGIGSKNKRVNEGKGRVITCTMKLAM